MFPRNVLEALSYRPLGYLRSGWPLRALTYLLTGGFFSTTLGLAVLGVLTAPFGRVAGVFAAVHILAFAVLMAGPFERWRLTLIDREPLRPLDGWRTVGYGAVSIVAVGWADLAVVLVSIGIPGFLLCAPLQPTAAPWQAVAGPVAGAVLLPVAAYPIGAWAGARGALARAVLAPRDRELREVIRSRARLVDAFETERRRIERDLHDGAQQRLVALHLKLGIAALDLPPGSVAAKEVGEAHTLAKEALAELRELIRGVHPQVLTERGIPAAVRDIAGRSPVPVDTDLDLPDRLPPGVEATAYFVVTEALTNIAKHSGAGRCRIAARSTQGVLRLEIEDDGVGGADTARGSGLIGLADRVAAADGRMFLSSPPGGPTLIRAEIPCHQPSAS
ncbi:sensor histidine kinase [Streptomyces millisiae]|uniref:histidine kinase n=1 Tax=Streptomyces millisiae TaxID=3075542 RepID=A0ABU2LNN4_9ACTN|nr:histidine kinase [Streptomyces sp. DSM 44918]MDT0318903.1 histidine kinase [Streptomyces sp. DSM 44918]